MPVNQYQFDSPLGPVVLPPPGECLYCGKETGSPGSYFCPGCDSKADNAVSHLYSPNGKNRRAWMYSAHVQNRGLTTQPEE